MISRMTTLDSELRAFYAARQQQIPDDVRAVMQRAGRELAASGQAGRALGVGERAPGFRLPTATGAELDLEETLARGPVVLTFYRGAWCPYCNLALRALQQHHDAVAARGARLLAVSPQIPDESLSLAEKHALSFDVLSDVGSETAARYKIAFDLPEDLAGVYDRLGFALERVNGGHSRTLPLPATFVIDAGGVIRWVFADADYTRRAEPAEVLAALDRLA